MRAYVFLHRKTEQSFPLLRRGSPLLDLNQRPVRNPGSLCSLPLALLSVSSELALASSATGGARARSS